VFVSPPPLDADELNLRIATAVETIDRNMLERVWDGLDLCRVTNGAHIGHLQGMYGKLSEYVIQMALVTAICLQYLPWYNKLKVYQSFTHILYIGHGKRGGIGSLFDPYVGGTASESLYITFYDDWTFSYFSRPLEENAVIVFIIDHDRLLQHPSQFSIRSPHM
jgi:hypothetical protein